jgi:signal peptidase I
MPRYVPFLLAGTLLAALALRKEFTLVTVTGDSMWPTLTPGDRVLVRRARRSRLRRGQVIVVEAPGPDDYQAVAPRGRGPADREWMIKRVAALPGDPRPDDILSATAGPLVPPGKLVVRGDNPAWSHDSRQIGYVPGDRLLGVVIRPMRRTGTAARTTVPSVPEDRASAEQFPDAVHGGPGFAVEPGDVESLVADEDEGGSGSDGVDGHVAAAAAGHGFPQRALARLAGQALGHGQGGSRQGGQVVRVHPVGIVADDQAIAASHRAARDPGHLVPQRLHLGQQRVVGHARPLPSLS